MEEAMPKAKAPLRHPKKIRTRRSARKLQRPKPGSGVNPEKRMSNAKAPLRVVEKVQHARKSSSPKRAAVRRRTGPAAVVARERQVKVRPPTTAKEWRAGIAEWNRRREQTAACEKDQDIERCANAEQEVARVLFAAPAVDLSSLRWKLDHWHICFGDLPVLNPDKWQALVADILRFAAEGRAANWADLMQEIERVDAECAAIAQGPVDRDDETEMKTDAEWDVLLHRQKKLWREALRTPAPHADAVRWKLNFVSREIEEGHSLDDFVSEGWPVLVEDVRAGLLLIDAPPLKKSKESVDERLFKILKKASPRQQNAMLLLLGAMAEPPEFPDSLRVAAAVNASEARR
jgi:hypothetical protein